MSYMYTLLFLINLLLLLLLLLDYPPKSLITAGSLISEYIFRDTTVTPPIKYSRRLSIGYAASRTQPVYGSTYRVLHEVWSCDSHVIINNMYMYIVS